MDLFYNVGDVADGGMMAGPLSSSKKSGFLSSDRVASPSGALWPLFPDGPPFLSCFALFIGFSPGSLVSFDLTVPFSTIFTPRSEISSSVTSLRNSWETPTFASNRPH
jgi:hypothetical protein